MDINHLNLSFISYFCHPEHGNCYKINSGYDENGHQVPIIKMTRPGRIQGMWIILNTSINDELKKFSVQNGGIVFITNRTESVLSVDGVMLKPGTVTNIGLSRTFLFQKPKPYSNCDGNTNKLNSFESILYKLVYDKTGQYNRKTCIDQCYQHMLKTM